MPGRTLHFLSGAWYDKTSPDSSQIDVRLLVRYLIRCNLFQIECQALKCVEFSAGHVPTSSPKCARAVRCALEISQLWEPSLLDCREIDAYTRIQYRQVHKQVDKQIDRTMLARRKAGASWMRLHRGEAWVPGRPPGFKLLGLGWNLLFGWCVVFAAQRCTVQALPRCIEYGIFLNRWQQALSCFIYVCPTCMICPLLLGNRSGEAFNHPMALQRRLAVCFSRFGPLIFQQVAVPLTVLEVRIQPGFCLLWSSARQSASVWLDKMTSQEFPEKWFLHGSLFHTPEQWRRERSWTSAAEHEKATKSWGCCRRRFRAWTALGTSGGRPTGLHLSEGFGACPQPVRCNSQRV